MPFVGHHKLEGSEEPLLPGIIVHIYGDIDTPVSECREYFPPRTTPYTAEELCIIIAQKKHITAFTFHLFALAVPGLSRWLPPNQEIVSSEKGTEEFIYRVRFKPHESHFSRIIDSKAGNKEAYEYYFLQLRHDFVSDQLRVSMKDIGESGALGLAVIDCLRYGKEHKIDLNQLKKLDAEKFIPKSAAQSFKLPWSKFRLSSSFGPKLEKEWEESKADSVIDTKWRYMKGLWKYVPNYGTETFLLSDNSCVYVDPYHEVHPGIYIGREDMVSLDHFCRIEELVDVTMSMPSLGSSEKAAASTEYNLHVSRTSGIPKMFKFPSKEICESFVALLDGYYRLTEDYHHHLCISIVSPMITRIKKIRSHGPVDNTWACNRLITKSQDQPKYNYNYLLKQMKDDLHSYTLVFLAGVGKQAICIGINKLQDGGYQIAWKDEAIFADMDSLLANYQKGNHKLIKLGRKLPPSKPMDPSIYLCRRFQSEDEVKSARPVNQREPVCLVPTVNVMEQIGQGSFTDVYRGALEKSQGAGDKMILQVAVKQLKLNASAILEHFTRSIHQVAFWNHSTIVRIHGLCLGGRSNPGVQLLMELAEWGNLEQYLNQPRSQLKIRHLMLIAEQVANALCYLHEDRQEEVHGNVRCRNILVMRYNASEVTVKLADPGLVLFANSQILEHPLNLERLPWLAPECLEDGGLQLTTTYKDLYAFGTTLWELFSSGERPFGKMTPQEIIEFVRSENRLKCPPQCPEDIYNNVILRSWNSCPEDRMPPKEMIANIRSVLCQGGGDDYVTKGRTENGHANHYETEFTARKDGATGGTNKEHVYSGGEFLEQNVIPPNCSPSASLSDFPALSPDNSFDMDSRAPFINKRNSDSLSQISGKSPTSPISPQMSAWSQATDMTHISADSFDISQEDQEGASRVPGRLPPGGRSVIQQRPLPEPPQPINIPYEKLSIEFKKGPLGQGHYGQVYKGMMVDRGKVKVIAVKELKPEMYVKYADEFEKEVQTMTRLSHENIVRLLGQSKDTKNSTDGKHPMLLVMEFVENGCLRNYLKTLDQKMEARSKERKLIQYTMETCEGMVYLSSQNIIHRDLATRNILVTKDERMKISDFGLSRIMDPGKDYYRATKSKELPVRWCGPEVMRTYTFTEKSDVWSFGVTVWEIFSYGRSPHLCDDKDLYEKLNNGLRLKRPRDCPEALYAILIYKCWDYHPNNRPSFEQLREELQNFKSKRL